MKCRKLLMCLALILVLLLPVNVLAADDSASLSGIVIPAIPEAVSGCDKIVIAESPQNGNIYLLATSAQVAFAIRYGDATIAAVDSSNSYYGYCSRYILTDGVWVLQGSDKWGIPGTLDNTYVEPVVYYNTVPIYAQDPDSYNECVPSDEVVFLSTSPSTSLPMVGIVAKTNQQIVGIVTQVQMMAVMQEVLKILPIGLVCWVGWIGLRKGLSLLRQVLFPA